MFNIQNPRYPLRRSLHPDNLAYRGVPSEYYEASLDAFPINKELVNLATNYIENLDVMLDDRMNLLFYGANGSGKTYVSSVIIREAYRQRYTSMRTTVQALVQMQFDKGKDDFIARKYDDIWNCQFLVLDELGKEQFGERLFNVTIVEELLRHRDTKGLPTIICTNLPLVGTDGIEGIYGKSIFSLVNGNFVASMFVGDDHRKTALREKRGISILKGGRV